MANIPDTIGNYKLEHELGRGATSQVWLGRHTFLQERAVAVKLLLSHDEESILRFTREAQLTSQLRHQNIIQIYDHATENTPFPYTVMELVSGGTLRQRIEKEGSVPLRDAMMIMRQIGAALDYAHGRGIIHRDVAPGNILIDSSGDRALLIDFGIARVPDQRHTSTDIIMGTPGFFSPEHARSATLVTALSDLFGLGVVLYFMLSGKLPWDEPPAHPEYRFDGMLSLTQRGVDVPPEVDRIVQAMLAIDPQKRYPSAGAAIDALDRALTKAGIGLDEKPLALENGTTVRAINTAPGFQSMGLVESEVEQTLAADLLREPFERSHARAEQLRDPMFLARLFDEWSRSGHQREFRKPHLGRIVNLREVRSRNVYFYQLNVLLETRHEPKEVEEPDANAPDFPILKEPGRWQIPIPPPSVFEDDPGRAEIVPGSERVLSCPRCTGSGYEICPNCKGARRVKVERPVREDGEHVALNHELPGPGLSNADQPTTIVRQVLVPCTVCQGAGQLTCVRCNGEGRLIQRKAFDWSRRTTTLRANDDLPNLDEDRLRKEIEVTKVYQERRIGGLKREWMAVPGLERLIETVQKELSSDTKVAMAEVQIDMIPYTEVRLDVGHSAIKVSDGSDDEHSVDDRVHLVQVYGFENHIRTGSFAYDGQRKLLYFWSIIGTVAAVVMLIGILLSLALA